MAYSVKYRETLRLKRGSPRHVQPAKEAIVQKMQLKAVSAPTLRADEDAYSQNRPLAADPDRGHLGEAVCFRTTCHVNRIILLCRLLLLFLSCYLAFCIVPAAKQ